MSAHETNPFGHFEPAAIVEIHDRLLEFAGTSWSDWDLFPPNWYDTPLCQEFLNELDAALTEDFEDAPLFVLKDPRICRLFPVWRQICSRRRIVPMVVLPFRNPIEVAKSLQSRNSFSLAEGYLLWLRYVLDAERYSRGLPRAFAAYDQFVGDLRPTLDRIKVRWPRLSAKSLQEAEHGVVPSLRHHVISPEAVYARSDIPGWVKEAYACYRELIDGEGEAVYVRLDKIATEFNAACEALAPAFKWREVSHETQKRHDIHQALAEAGETARRLEGEISRRERELDEVRTSHGREVEQLYAQVAGLQADRAELIEGHGELLRRRAERAARNEALLLRELRQQKERIESDSELLRQQKERIESDSELLRQQKERIESDSELLKQQKERIESDSELLRQQKERIESDSELLRQKERIESEGELLRRRAEEAEASLQAVLSSSSWRLTQPFRTLGLRHPWALTRLKGLAAQHPLLRRAVAQTLRYSWRLGTLQPLRRAAPVPAALATAGTPPPSTEGVVPFAATLIPAEALTFKPRVIPPNLTRSVVPHRVGGHRYALCVGHVLPFPPRAGNEYRIHRLLHWLADQGWDLLVVICPLPHEMPTAEQMADAAAAYPNLIICDRNGTLHYHLADDGHLLDALRPSHQSDIPTLLGEENGGTPMTARMLALQRSFCPDLLVELILQLQDIRQPDLLLAQYIFMTRPFALLKPGIITAIDTIDVFSSKAKKVEQYGVSDGLALTEVEEQMLLRRADILIGIQPDEAAELARLAPECRVVSVGVDFPLMEPDTATPRPGPMVLLVASGNPMNIKGLKDFLEMAWPSVLQRVPEAELLIVGAVGDSIGSLPERVLKLGRIEDLASIYRKARVVINPTIAGTGLKIKTVEALSHLKPVVCWPSGVDGVPDEARAFCHVAASWPDFADSLSRLLSDDFAASAIERERETLRHAFSPVTIYAPLQEALQDA